MGRIYSQRLGLISDGQFQAALDHFGLGSFIQAEPIPFGLFGQNVFITSTRGEYVLRGRPHFEWQFPTEQFYTRLLHERTLVPVPWPYLIDFTTDIFGWSYVLMPRMPGLQLDDLQIKAGLAPGERRAIAQTLGENLAHMQKATWPFSGRYDTATQTVEPFNLARELAPAGPERRLAGIPSITIPYSERVKVCLRHHLGRSQEVNPAATTPGDIAWVEELIAGAEVALNDSFEPCLLMEDYKEGNLVVMRKEGRWRVSGVFDLMGCHFGDGEADLARQYAIYLDEDQDLRLAREFLQGYLSLKAPRPGFLKRFPIYMLLDRSIIWEFVQRHDPGWWDQQQTFRDWASHYLVVDTLL